LKKSHKNAVASGVAGHMAGKIREECNSIDFAAGIASNYTDLSIAFSAIDVAFDSIQREMLRTVVLILHESDVIHYELNHITWLIHRKQIQRLEAFDYRTHRATSFV
jgi:hypothetical protein